MFLFYAFQCLTVDKGNPLQQLQVMYLVHLELYTDDQICSRSSIEIYKHGWVIKPYVLSLFSRMIKLTDSNKNEVNFIVYAKVCLNDRLEK